MAAGLTSCAGPRRKSVLMVAAETGSLEAVTAFTKALLAMFAGTKTVVSVSKVAYFVGLLPLPGRRSFHHSIESSLFAVCPKPVPSSQGRQVWELGPLSNPLV